MPETPTNQLAPSNLRFRMSEAKKIMLGGDTNGVVDKLQSGVDKVEMAINSTFTLVEGALDIAELAASILEIISEPWRNAAGVAVNLAKEEIKSIFEITKSHYIFIPPIKINKEITLDDKIAYWLGLLERDKKNISDLKYQKMKGDYEYYKLAAKKYFTILKISIADIFDGIGSVNGISDQLKLQIKDSINKLFVATGSSENPNFDNIMDLMSQIESILRNNGAISFDGRDGLKSLCDVLTQSLDDPGDLQRPQLTANQSAVSALAVLVMPDILSFLKIGMAIKNILNMPVFPVPPPIDLKAKPVSLMDGSLAVQVTVNYNQIGQNILAYVGNTGAIYDTYDVIIYKKILTKTGSAWKMVKSFQYDSIPGTGYMSGDVYDTEVEKGGLYKYKCSIRHKGNEIMASTEAVCFVEEKAIMSNSVYPDWVKLFDYSLPWGQYADQILKYVDDILSMIESWIKSSADTIRGYIEYVKKVLEEIQKRLDDIFELINELLDLLRVITSVTTYASIFTIEAGGNEAIKEAYRKMLVNDVSSGLKSELSKYRDNGLIMALGVVKPGPILPSAWAALFNTTQKESEVRVSNVLSDIEERVRKFKEAQQAFSQI